MSTVGVDLGVWKYTQNRTLSHRISHVGFCRTGSCSLAALVSFYEMTRTVHIQYRSRVLGTPKNDDVSSSTGRHFFICNWANRLTGETILVR